jgi:hypothetical protein
VTDGQRRTLGALADTLFPAERPLYLDAVSVDLAPTIAAWLPLLPTPQRTALLAALTTFDAGFSVWLGRAVAFADGTAAERRAWVEAVAEAPSWPVRKAFEALRFALLLHYAERPAVQAAITERRP